MRRHHVMRRQLDAMRVPKYPREQAEAEGQRMAELIREGATYHDACERVAREFGRPTVRFTLGSLDGLRIRAIVARARAAA